MEAPGLLRKGPKGPKPSKLLADLSEKEAPSGEEDLNPTPETETLNPYKTKPYQTHRAREASHCCSSLFRPEAHGA